MRVINTDYLVRAINVVAKFKINKLLVERIRFAEKQISNRHSLHPHILPVLEG